MQEAGVRFTKTSQGSQETDVNAAGKAIGFDMIYLAIASPTAARPPVAQARQPRADRP